MEYLIGILILAAIAYIIKGQMEETKPAPKKKAPAKKAGGSAKKKPPVKRK
jgi:hypothetical protein